MLNLAVNAGLSSCTYPTCPCRLKKEIGNVPKEHLILRIYYVSCYDLNRGGSSNDDYHELKRNARQEGFRYSSVSKKIILRYIVSDQRW